MGNEFEFETFRGIRKNRVRISRVHLTYFARLLLTCACLFFFVFVLHQIDKQLDAVFSKGKPHIKKAAPVGGEQIKGEQQG